MKKILACSIYVFAVAFCLPTVSKTNLIGPPNGLDWGMSYSEAKTTLKSKNIKLEKPKDEKKMKLPKGFKVARVGKYKILDRKTDFNKAIFNADGELCSFQIIFRWSETGTAASSTTKSKGMSFYHANLKQAIAAKYSGEGFKEHNEPDKDGNVPALAFRDEVGNELGIYFQTESTLFGYAFNVIVNYSNEEILAATRKQQKTTDKF